MIIILIMIMTYSFFKCCCLCSLSDRWIDWSCFAESFTFATVIVFPAKCAADGEVQLSYSDSGRSDRGRSTRRGLGSAHSASAAQDEARSLSAVHSRWATPTPGGDGTQTEQVPFHVFLFLCCASVKKLL